MSDHSAIEWTDATWNPVRGCTKVSPGCTHCYAETFAERFRGVSGHPYQEGFDLRLVPGKLCEPLRWTQPRMVFVNSMSDLFHEAVPDSYIQAIARVMQKTPWHTYQVLTKRALRMSELLSGNLQWAAKLPNVWWGVSVENKKHGLPRISLLKTVPARTRFLSIEPLLEDLGDLDLELIHWVIVGGESGHSARTIQESWVLSILEACRKKGIPFFFKQWGGQHKKRNGRLLQGRTYDEMPARHLASVADARRRRDLWTAFETEALGFSAKPISLLSLAKPKSEAQIAS